MAVVAPFPDDYSPSEPVCTSSDIGAISNIDFQLGRGTRVDCVFPYEGLGRIVLDVVSDPPGHPQKIRFNPDWADEIYLSDTDEPLEVAVSDPGPHNFSMIGSYEGWWIDPNCRSDIDGLEPFPFEVLPGEIVTCTVVAHVPGQILIDTVTTPAEFGGGMPYMVSWEQEEWEGQLWWESQFRHADLDPLYNSGPLSPDPQFPGEYEIRRGEMSHGWDIESSVPQQHDREQRSV